MMVNRVQVLAFSAVLLVASLAGATVTVPKIFGDHMVLQQAATLPVWGKAAPGERVVVTLGKTVGETVADAQGKWRIDLPKQKPGGPIEMTVMGSTNTVAFTDVLIGEVWVASGQSNMEWVLRDTENAQYEASQANYPEIRFGYIEPAKSGTPLEDCDCVWFACSPEEVIPYSAVAYYFVRDLHKALKCPVGVIHTSRGGSTAEAWTSRPTLESDPDFKPILDRWDAIVARCAVDRDVYDSAMVEWKQAAEKARTAGRPEPPQPPIPSAPDTVDWRPAGLYNAMIHPLVPFAIQGAIWYQGEANWSRAHQYQKLFPAMIQDWRNVWGQGDFPFYFAQLANFVLQEPYPASLAWAEVREAQTMALNVRNTGMAVTVDIGNPADIHPRNKKDVGRRLALNALANTYGKKIEFSGPMLESMRIDGDKAIITLSHAKGLKAKDGQVKGFVIAGEDQQFVAANAVIKGKTVVVSSDKVANPVAVRYAWADNPENSLYNSAGLPASPFRTDNWQGVTFGGR